MKSQIEKEFIQIYMWFAEEKPYCKIKIGSTEVVSSLVRGLSAQLLDGTKKKKKK